MRKPDPERNVEHAPEDIGFRVSKDGKRKEKNRFKRRRDERKNAAALQGPLLKPGLFLQIVQSRTLSLAQHQPRGIKLPEVVLPRFSRRNFQQERPDQQRYGGCKRDANFPNCRLAFAHFFTWTMLSNH